MSVFDFYKSLPSIFVVAILLAGISGCAASGSATNRPAKHPDTPMTMGSVMDMERPGVY